MGLHAAFDSGPREVYIFPPQVHIHNLLSKLWGKLIVSMAKMLATTNFKLTAFLSNCHLFSDRVNDTLSTLTCNLANIHLLPVHTMHTQNYIF